MNKEVKLQPTLGMIDTFSFMGILDLDLKNTSDKTLVFPPDFGVRVFIKQGDHWMPVQNNFRYPESGYVIPPAANDSVGATVDVMPVIPALGKSALRIAVLGQEKETGDKVGAFYDVEVSP
jgi:hypothetical protein